MFSPNFGPAYVLMDFVATATTRCVCEN